VSRLARLGTIAVLPSKAVEETAHAVAAWPWARRIALTIEPGSGGATTHAVLRDDTPAWGRWLIRHAPQLAGAVLAAVALAALASGLRPSSPLELVAAIASALWWAKLVAPEDSVEEGDR